MFHYIRQNRSGQVMAFIALIVLALVMFWMTVVNLGTLTRERMRMQNAVDAAAITAVRIQARALNIIGQLNNAQMAFGVPYLTHYCNYGKYALRGIVQSQNATNRAYGGGYAYWQAMAVARENAPGCTLININPAGMFSLKLRRNRGTVVYWGHLIPFPFIGMIYVPCVIHGLYDSNTDRWLERTWNPQQPPHTLSFIATKGAEQAPIGGGLLGVNIPSIQTNAKGKVWLNSRNNMGGLPRRNSWIGLSMPLVFDAKLTPLSGMQH